MKNKTLKLIFIMAIFMISFLLMTNVRAEISWDGENNTITIPYGESITNYLEIDNYIDTTGRVNSMNQYSITNNEGTQIFTGWNQPSGQNNSYYGRMNVVTNVFGHQTMTINFTPGNGSTDPSVKTTVLTINCVGSDNLKTVIEALGGEMPNAYTLNTDDVYTSLEGLTGTKYEAILDSASAYDALGTAEKTLVDQVMNDKLGMTAAEVQDAAINGIEDLANAFVNSTRLNDSSITDLNELKEVYTNALTLGDEYNSLSPRTKERVMVKISDATDQSSNWDDVEEFCRNQIKIIDATLFLNKYIDVTDGVLNEDKVIEGEEDWNNLDDAVKGLVNEALLEAEGIEKTYPELLLRAKANRFLNEKLTTEDGKIILEANNNNYKIILAAKDDYDALSDEVKEEVNRILTEKGNTTYPELLKDAQKLEPTPKTGDIVIAMIIALVISTLGLTATFIIKRKK